MQRGNLTPKCGKPNMALSQIGDKAKLVLVRGMVLRGEEAIFGFPIVQAKIRKRRKEEI